jgi:hypothetical protein
MNSKSDGSCKGDPKHSWKTGESLFADKKSDGGWVICIDEVCYKKLGGTEIQAKSFKQGRTIEMSLAFVKAFDDYAWKLANTHASELLSELSKDSTWGLGEQTNKRAIAVESIYHTLCEVWNGK